jgi:hypothetical protein
MEKVEIFEHELRGKNNSNYKVGIITCSSHCSYPKEVLDNAVYSYVEGVNYNEFIELYSNNHFVRVILSGINELDYTIINDRPINYLDFFEQALIQNESEVGKIAIFRGGMQEEKPLEYIDSLVREKYPQTLLNQFVEIHMDNPWVRLIIIGINELAFKKFNIQKLGNNA